MSMGNYAKKERKLLKGGLKVGGILIAGTMALGGLMSAGDYANINQNVVQRAIYSKDVAGRKGIQSSLDNIKNLNSTYTIVAPEFKNEYLSMGFGLEGQLNDANSGKVMEGASSMYVLNPQQFPEISEAVSSAYSKDPSSFENIREVVDQDRVANPDMYKEGIADRYANVLKVVGSKEIDQTFKRQDPSQEVKELTGHFEDYVKKVWTDAIDFYFGKDVKKEIQNNTEFEKVKEGVQKEVKLLKNMYETVR